jgi:hypothetical protein
VSFFFSNRKTPLIGFTKKDFLVEFVGMLCVVCLMLFGNAFPEV